MNQSLALQVKNLHKEYPGVEVIKNISFDVKKNNIHAFLGPNGAGKSTTMRIISGLLPASSGEIFVNDKLIDTNPAYCHQNIGFLPENLPLYQDMSVEEYLVFVRNIHTIKTHDKTIDFETIIKRCGLDKVRNKLIRKLSKGYKQRVGIAQTLSYDADLIILDEPLVGLDPNAISEIRELILDLKERHTVLLSTHQLHEVDLLCDEITIINNGKILINAKKGELELEKYFKENVH
jgi:ABC-2 type transport system ATP-binding protein